MYQVYTISNIVNNHVINTDVTFKNANTNKPVSITAKYDTEGPTLFGYQEGGGHKLHHGLILNYDGNEIPLDGTFSKTFFLLGMSCYPGYSITPWYTSNHRTQNGDKTVLDCFGFRRILQLMDHVKIQYLSYTL